MTEQDQPPPSTGESKKDQSRAAKAANLFDVRRLIAALFMLYGVVLTITGIVGSHRVKTKAAGINIDLYTGIGMIVFAAVMISWALLRPTVAEPDETQGDGSGQIRGAAAS